MRRRPKSMETVSAVRRRGADRMAVRRAEREGRKGLIIGLCFWYDRSGKRDGKNEGSVREAAERKWMDACLSGD